ncbi:hypothetical protein BD626DRAFT_627772, partial [Schizophyllum amplum]
MNASALNVLLARSSRGIEEFEECALDASFIGAFSTSSGLPQAHPVDVGVIHFWKSNKAEAERLSISSANYALHNDLRRKYIFTVSISGQNMDRVTIHCHSRMFTVASKVFDLHRNADELVQFMLFTKYASTAQLGLDPSLTRIVDGDNNFQYEVKDSSPHKLCRTVSTAMDFSLKTGTSSSAIRTYKALRMTKGADCSIPGDWHSCVLRDYWLGDSNIYALDLPARTGVVLGNLGHATCTTEGYRDKIKKLTTSDCTVLVAEFSTEPYEQKRQTERCTHDITVYAKTSEELNTIEDPAKLFHALSQCVNALDGMRRAGHIHGDMGPENILVSYRTADVSFDTKQLNGEFAVKITGMEYRGMYNNAKRPDLHGNPNFIAVEVAHGAHVFANHTRRSFLRFRHALAYYFFAYNPLHDLESLLWIAVDFVLHHLPLRSPIADSWEKCKFLVKALEEYGVAIFPVLTWRDTVDKMKFYRRGEVLERPCTREDIEDLAAASHGEQSALLQIFHVLEELANTYRAVENTATVSREIFHAYYRDMKCFEPSLFDTNAGIYAWARLVFAQLAMHFAAGHDPVVRVDQVNRDTG